MGLGWGSGTSKMCKICHKKKAKKGQEHCGSWKCSSKWAASKMKSSHSIPNDVADFSLNYPCGCSKSMANHAQNCKNKKK